ncbi:MAG: diaminopimelate decarboxylase, partial [Candidatus Altiarchaeota archaeon]|nr:diaminopimelate decarboxylase [Candidatus Altiarchaeota archaeon]
PYKNFVNVDCGFNTLARPVLYDSFHRIKVLGKKGSEETYDIAGNICESGDILGKDRELPAVEKGDVLAVLDAGAYGFSMASQYNCRPRPAEILVRENSVEVIRERETWDDLWRGETVPDDLNK